MARCGSPGSQALQRGRQSVTLEFDRMESAGDVTDLSNRFIDQAQGREVSRRAASLRDQDHREGFHGERGSQNMLAQVVMHFAADPALLTFSGIEKGVFQEFTFSARLSSEAAVRRWMKTNMSKRLRKWFDPASFGRALKVRSRRMTRNLQRLSKPRQGREPQFSGR